ncbi:MAG: hypothetical protein WCP91_00340 [Candidatus Berkelbacteria bacterium]
MFVYKYCSKCKKRNHKGNNHCIRCGDKLTKDGKFGKDVFAITLSITILLSSGVAFASRSYFINRTNKIEQAKTEVTSTGQGQSQTQQAPTATTQPVTITTPQTNPAPKNTAPSATNTTTNNTSGNSITPTTSTPTPDTTPVTTPATITGIKIISNNFIQIPECDFITPIGSPPPCNHYNPIPINLIAEYSDNTTKPLSWNDATVSGIPQKVSHPPISALLIIDTSNNLLDLGANAGYYLSASGGQYPIFITAKYQQWTYTKLITLYVVDLF